MAKKRKRQNKNLVKKLERVYSEGYSNEYQSKQRELLQEIKTSARVTKEESQLLRQLKRISKEDIDEWDAKGNPINKFRIRHIEKLGVPYDVFFMYGKKGIGKTVQLREYCKQLLASDPKAEIFLIRNTREELVALEAQLNNSTGDPNRDWPCILIGERLYRRRADKQKGARLKACGHATYVNASGLIKYKGGEYTNIKAIIWDECNNESEAFKLDRNSFLKFINFVSSIVRDKKDVKIYMFGNLLRNSDGTVNNPLLRVMGISQSTELKIIKVPTLDGSDSTTVIYWNSMNSYQGIEKGKLTTMFRNLDISELETNLPKPYISKILDENEWAECVPIFAWVFTHKQERWALFYGYFEFDQEDDIKFSPGRYYSVLIEPFDPDVSYGYRFCSDDVTFKNNNPGLVKHISEEDLIDFLEDLYDRAELGRIWFGSEDSEEIFSELLRQWVKRYKLTYEARETF